MWIQFKYERLPSFCFHCGKIGHTEKFCENLFDNPQEKETRKYDSSLRAPVRKQGLNHENQWIRGADGAALTPGRKLGKEMDGELTGTTRREDNVIYATGDQFPSKSGLSERKDENSEGDQAKFVTNVEAQNVGILNERREKYFD